MRHGVAITLVQLCNDILCIGDTGILFHLTEQDRVLFKDWSVKTGLIVSHVGYESVDKLTQISCGDADFQAIFFHRVLTLVFYSLRVLMDYLTVLDSPTPDRCSRCH